MERSTRARRTALVLGLAAAAVAIAAPARAGLIVLASGAGAVATTARDDFRTAVGGGTVAGANGSFGGIRREVNWDGVPDAFADPSLMPATFFVNTSPRGLGLTGSVTGFAVSAKAASGNPTLFESFDGAGQGNGTYAFNAFSQERLFTGIGGNEFDVSFFTPGTGFADPSFVKAFGVMFVDNTGGTFPTCASLQAFNGAQSLGFVCAPVTTVGGFSFLGLAATGSDVFTSVRIHLGNAAIGTAQDATHEVVVMDDFIYAEPGRTTLGDPAPVPEPVSLLLLGVGLVEVARRASRRR